MMSQVEAQRAQKKMEADYAEFRKAKESIDKLNASREKFLTQHTENEHVLKELKLLEEGAEVFKLIGPVLVKQDGDEAQSNVQKRLDYIRGELTRLDKMQGDAENVVQEKGKQIKNMQDKLQRQMQKAQQAAQEAAAGQTQ